MKKLTLILMSIMLSISVNATDLKTLIKNNPDLGKAIEASILSAHQQAVAKNLQNIDKHYWPKSLNEYYKYLDDYAKWIPTEADISSRENYDQEIMSNLCHFYWLINEVQNIPEFSVWLGEYADSWGDFLNTTESITPESLQSFMDQPQFKMEQ